MQWLVGCWIADRYLSAVQLPISPGAAGSGSYSKVGHIGRRAGDKVLWAIRWPIGRKNIYPTRPCSCSVSLTCSKRALSVCSYFILVREYSSL
jgi:hypothetical protein